MSFDTDVYYITLASSDDPNGTPSEFENVLPRTINFGSGRLKVALASVTYQLDSNNPPPAGYEIAFINTNAVVSNITVGSQFTNNIGRILLPSSQNPYQPQDWTTDTYHWFDAASTRFSQIDASMTFYKAPPGAANATVPLVGPTFITLAFKIVD